MELNYTGSQKGKLELPDAIFATEFNGPLVHQVVTAYLSAARAGTHAQKTRSEVRGGGIKPFRQKGTGRARAGTIRSPLWRKGGVVFAAKPRSYEQKVNKKMYRGALRAIFSELIRQDRLHIVDAFEVETPKTKAFLTKAKDILAGDHSFLLISEAVGENLYLSARNLPNVDVRDVMALDPVALIKADKVIVTVPAMKQIQEMLA
ncbi:MAG: 50S ribosomal protein L4 [Gammaproteobacteria bacterium]|nr:50S ribosomal protein L4 [Gammaproteobacteria bacterium]